MRPSRSSSDQGWEPWQGVMLAAPSPPLTVLRGVRRAPAALPHILPHCHPSGSLQMPCPPRGSPVGPCPAPFSVPSADHPGDSFHLDLSSVPPFPWSSPAQPGVSCSQESSEAPEASLLRIPQHWEFPSPWGAPRDPQGRAGTRRDTLYQLGPCLC